MKMIEIVFATARQAATSQLLAHRVPKIGLATTAAVGLFTLSTWVAPVQGATLSVPNGSFESPTPPPGFPASPQVDNWQKSPQPVWFDPSTAGISWDQLAGVFPNTAVGTSNHIDNVDGNQAAYMFALPQVTLFQDAFGATFDVGKSYKLTVGILGGGGIPAGASFEIGLYYRDGANNMVTVAATPITFNTTDFLSATHLIDFNVNVPAVQSGDAWAGKNIGVELLSTSGTGAGYWDVDNVRLTSAAVPEPGTVGLLAIGASGLLISRWRSGRRA